MARSDKSLPDMQAKLQRLKSQRAATLGVGSLGLVSGIAMFASGQSDVSDAKSTPGCSAEGSHILCVDEHSLAKAQSDLDSGERKQVLGNCRGIGGRHCDGRGVEPEPVDSAVGTLN